MSMILIWGLLTPYIGAFYHWMSMWCIFPRMIYQLSTHHRPMCRGIASAMGHKNNPAKGNNLLLTTHLRSSAGLKDISLLSTEKTSFFVRWRIQKIQVINCWKIPSVLMNAVCFVDLFQEWLMDYWQHSLLYMGCMCHFFQYSCIFSLELLNTYR